MAAREAVNSSGSKYLNILLQKSDPFLEWGFDIIGGRDKNLPLTINQVKSRTFCSQYLSEGDIILQIDGIDATSLRHEEVTAFIKRPSKSLDLLLLKRGALNSKYNCQQKQTENSSRTYARDDIKNADSDNRGQKVKKYKKRSSSVPPKVFFRRNEESEFSEISESCRKSRKFWEQLDNKRVQYSDTDEESGCYGSENISESSVMEKIDMYQRMCDQSTNFEDLKLGSRRSSKSDTSGVDTLDSISNDMLNLDTEEKRCPYLPKSFKEFQCKAEFQKNRMLCQNQNLEKTYIIIEKQPAMTENASPVSSNAQYQNGSVSMSPPPPPPPPPVLGSNSIPAVRLKSEIPDRLEPPATIQNAMLTKDKKPFTYTPGGIDLSEIKSPRMQRRIAMNAQEPPDNVLPSTTTTVTSAQLPASVAAAVTPQLAIPVLPQTSAPRNNHYTKSRTPEPQTNATGTDQSPKLSQNFEVKNNPPSAPQPPLNKAPTPWLQKPAQKVGESQPVWIQREKQVNQRNEQPQITAQNSYLQNQQLQKLPSQTQPQNPSCAQNQLPQDIYVQNQCPQNIYSQNQQQQIYVQNNEPQKSTYPKNGTSFTAQKVDKDAGSGTRIIPIHVEGSMSDQLNKEQRKNRWVAHNESSQVNGQKNNASRRFSGGAETGEPIQSRSFKVIQKITGSDENASSNNNEHVNIVYNTEGVPLSQLRKLHLADDDRAFMNKVKTQVDEETYLHNETDPRYRGSSIPSKSFRILQSMTSDYTQGARSPEFKNQNVRVIPIQNEENANQNYVPPSERSVQEDTRKYTGSSIPSRSFRMLQAMTATEAHSTGRLDETDF